MFLKSLQTIWRFFLFLACLAIIMLLGAYYALPLYVSKAYEIKTSKIQYRWDGITAYNLVHPKFKSSRVRIYVDIKELLKGRVHRVVIEDLSLFLDYKPFKPPSIPVNVDSIEINNASIVYQPLIGPAYAGHAWATASLNDGKVFLKVFKGTIRTPQLKHKIHINARSLKVATGISLAGHVQPISNGSKIKFNAIYSDEKGANITLNANRMRVKLDDYTSSIRQLRGTQFEATAKFNFLLKDDKVTEKHSITLNKISGNFDKIRIQNGVFKSQSVKFLNLHSITGNLSNVRGIYQKYPFTVYSARVSKRGSIINLNNISAKALGVKVGIPTFKIGSNRKQNLKIKIKYLNVHDLAKKLKIKNIRSDAILTGSVPLTLYPSNSFAIKNAFVKTTRPGWFKYHWAEALNSSNMFKNMAAKAIKNFRYKYFVINLSKKENKDLDINLKIKGKNPKYMKGQIFDLNINLSGDILKSIKSINRFKGS